MTPFLLLFELLKGILLSDGFYSSKPSTPMGSIQFVVSCLHAMVLPGQTSNKLRTLDYDKNPLQKVQFLPIAFYGDILFYHRCFQLLTTFPKCKAWTKNMMALHGVSWSQPI